MRVVVTGASGNVGTPLLAELKARPEVDQVVGVVRRPPGPDAGEPYAGVEWHSADIGHDDLTEAFRGADVVVHLAFLIQPSHRPQLMHDVNVVGTRRVFEAADACGARALVVASSMGAYSPGPTSRDEPVDESWPTDGVEESIYSRHKAELERALDRLEARRPDLRVVRIRPGVVFSRRAAAEQSRYFLGPLVPASLLRPGLLPALPLPDDVRLQLVAADDVARVFADAVTGDLRGGLNVRSEPVLDADGLAEALGSRRVPLPAGVARAVVEATWRARLQPTDRGWLELGLQLPVMDDAKVRATGWEPEVAADDLLREWLDAARAGEGGTSPVLRPRVPAPKRVVQAVRSVFTGGAGTGPST